MSCIINCIPPFPGEDDLPIAAQTINSFGSSSSNEGGTASSSSLSSVITVEATTPPTMRRKQFVLLETHHQRSNNNGRSNKRGRKTPCTATASAATTDCTSTHHRATSSTNHSIQLPLPLLIQHILPCLDRETYESFMVANKETLECCTSPHHNNTTNKLPWPQTCLDAGEEILCVSFSTNNRLVACGCGDGDIHLWDFKGRKSTLHSHTMAVHSVAFSPTNSSTTTTTLASGCSDGSIRIWFVEDNRPTGNSLLLGAEGHEHPVHSLVFHPQHDRLLVSAAYNEPIVRVWDIEQGGVCSALLIGDASPVESISLSSTGNSIASATCDGSIYIWSFVKEDDMGMSFTNMNEPSRLMGTDPRRRRHHRGGGLVRYSQCGGNEERLFSWKSGKLVSWNTKERTCINLLDTTTTTRNMELSPNDALMAHCHRDGSVELTPVQHNHAHKSQSRSSSNNNSSWAQTQWSGFIHHQATLAFSPDSRTLALGGDDGGLHLWSVRRRQ